MSLDLSVVIVSYNTRDLLRECLSSVLATLAVDDLAYEVFVVDNASPDGSAEMVAAEFPSVRLIANADNRGFAAANNQALAVSKGRYLLLLNPDTVVQGRAVEKLVEFMDNHPRAGAAGVALLNPDGSPQHSCFRFPTLLMAFLDFFPSNHRLTNSRWNGRYPLARYAGPPFEIDHPLGACFMVRREAAEQVGWFDESFYIYCEEIDWCFRLKQAGWRIYCVPQAKVIHHGAQSTSQFRGPMLVALHRSRQRLFRKHYGAAYCCLIKHLTHLGAMAEARRARRAAKRGEIDLTELQRRLSTFEKIRCL